MIVTAVERERGRRRVKLYLDGQFALALGRELAAEQGVHPGRTMTAAELAALVEAEARRSAMDSALRLLSHRPRSEQELRDRLRRKDFQAGVIEATLRRLGELGYVDDEAFARFWAEARQASRPQSGRLLAAELRRRGVSPETAQDATQSISDEEVAYGLAQRRLPALRTLAYRTFRERLGRYLMSRGFSYEVARGTIERCWAEISPETGESATN